MPIFRHGTVVKVPFPYTDKATRQRRPAVVVSNGPIGDGDSLLWVVMVTAAANRAWDCDILIEDHRAVGLPAPSRIRPVKIATIQANDAEPLGELPADVIAEVDRTLLKLMGAR